LAEEHMDAKFFSAAVICALLSTACAHRPGDGSQSLEQRTTMNAVLEETVGTKSNKPGDQVTAISVESFKTRDGVLIPRNSKLIGSVTYVRGANAGEYQSILGVAFDRAVLESGKEIPLQASVRAIAVPRASVPIADSPGAPAMKSSPSIGSFGGGRRVIVNGSDSARPSARTLERSYAKSPGAVGGLDANGLLIAQSRGVFGFPGLNMNESAAAGIPSTLISAILSDVKLETGTRILLSVDNSTSRESSGSHSGAMH
jgi:hypothetical protein